MTECLFDHPTGSPWLNEESVADLASYRAHLSPRGRQVLGRLLLLLPSHLKSQIPPGSPFQPALLLSICEVLHPEHTDGSADQNNTSVLPSVLGKLRDWRLLDSDHRYGPGGIHKLALDLAGIIDKSDTSTGSPNLHHPSRARLRMRWVSSDSQHESQERESSSSTPLSSLSGIPDPAQAQECAHTLLDLKGRRSDTGRQSCQARRLSTPDSEDTVSTVSLRHPSVSGFRSGCSACRHPRLSPPTSAPSSPRVASKSFSDVNRVDVNVNCGILSPRFHKPSLQPASPRKLRREGHKSSHPLYRCARVDENEPPAFRASADQQRGGVSFPRQSTHSPLISNAPLPREPFSPVVASVQRRLGPSHLLNRAGKGDKHTTSRRFASVDLRLSIANPRPNPASPDDLHRLLPVRAQSLSHTLVKPQAVGSVGSTGVAKLLSNAAGSRSSKRLPFWSESRSTAGKTSVTPTESMSPSAAEARLPNSRSHPRIPRSRPSIASIPRSLPSDLKHRDRRLASSQSHRYTSSDGVLPFLPSSPLIHAYKRQL